MSNNDINIHDISGQVAFAQVGGNLTGDIIAGNKTIIQNIIQQVAKQIVTAPYKFLASYDISDRDIFFGREAVIEDLVGKLPRYKTLVINGRSGSGKTSLINAGLIPRLAENGYQYLSFRDYHDPLRQFSEHIRQNPAFQAYADAAHSLPVFLHALISQQHAPVVVIFDQFERFFLNVPTALRQQFIQEIKACVESALTGKEIAVIFAEREEYFGQFTREFNAVIPAFLKETEIIDLPLLGRAEACAAILKPLEKIAVKIGYDPEFVETVLLPGLMGESSGGVTIDPPHLQIVCNQLYEQAKTRYAAKLERGGVVEIDRALYDELRGATGILQSYLDDRLAKIVPQLPDGQAVLRAMLKTMVTTTTGTRAFVALPDVQRRLADVTPEIVADGLRLLREERIIEMRGQDEATTYSLSHEVMVEKVQSWFDERELQRKKAQETLERGLVEWQSSQALLNENQVKQIRQWAQPEDITAQAEELLTTSQRAYEEQQRKEAEQERRIRLGKRILWSVIAVALVVASLLTFWALRNAKEANDQKQIAITQKDVAVKEKQRAEDQTIIAQANATEASRRAMVSLAQALGSQAIDQSIRYNGPLSALLARQAYLFHHQYQGAMLAQMDNALRRTLEGFAFQSRVFNHPRQVSSVAFSPDGKHFASGCYDNTVRVWDLTHPDAAPQVLTGHKGSVFSVAFSPDGTHLASGSEDKTVRIWDLMQPESIPRVLTGYKELFFCLAFSPDGKRLASDGDDMSVWVWDLTLPDVAPRVLKGHTNAVASVAFSPDGTYLASGSWDFTVRLWDLTRQDSVPIIFAKHNHGVLSVAFSPDGRYLAFGSEIVQIGVVSTSLNTGPIQPAAAPRVLTGRESWTRSVVFSPDGTRLAAGSDDKTVRIWDLTRPTATPRILAGHEDRVFSVVFSPDGTRLASGSEDTTVRVWNLTQPAAALRVLIGHDDGVSSVAFSPDGRYLASGSGDKTVRLWDLTQPAVAPRILTGHEGAVGCLAFNPDGLRLASGSDDRTVRVWDLMQPDSAALRIFTGHEWRVTSVAFSPDGTRLASGGYEGTVRVWDLTQPDAAPRILTGHTNMVTSVAFSPDGKFLASGSYDHTVRVWDLTQLDPARRILAGHKWQVTSVVFSPDGKFLASGSYDRTVRIWDLMQPAASPRVLTGHEAWVASVAFSPDGKLLASGSDDTTVRVWDLTRPESAPFVFSGHENTVWSVTFSPDGIYLASGSSDKTIRIWNIQTDELAAQICEQVGRNLTWDEWQQFIGPDIPYERTCPDLPEHPSVAEARGTAAENK